MRGVSLHIERRERTSRLWQVLALFASILGSLLLSALLILYARASVGDAFAALFAGAFGSWKAFLETLVKATPLILTGLSILVAFQGKIWNIGAEGQLFAGAMAGYWVSVHLSALPPAALFVAILLAAFAGGALCGWIPGYLKARLRVDEVIVTVMMNYVITYLLSYLLAGPWREQDQYYHMTPLVPESAHFPVLFANSRLHIGFLVALLAAALVFWLMTKTRLGYEIRAIGLNPTAARFKGINVPRVIILIMLISGGLAGVAGAGEVMGLHYRLKAAISTGYGYTGIIIAMLAGLTPFGVIPAAILFGGLVNGSNRMQILTGVPTPVVYAMQAIVLLLFLGTQVLANYRMRVVRDA